MNEAGTKGGEHNLVALLEQMLIVPKGQWNGGGTGVNASMPNLDAVQGYLDEANSESSDFKSFLKDFFSFLPNDILLLLCIALSVCIVCRIVGR